MTVTFLRHLFSLFLLLLLGATILLGSARFKTHNQLNSPPEINAIDARGFGNLPMSFVANRGQASDHVRFIARGSNYTLALTSTDTVLELHTPQPAALRMKLSGANSTPQIDGQEQLPGKVNYFIGNDPKGWHTDLPTYAKVCYRSVYPGIDLVYYGNQQQLEYDFIIAPGADPREIKLNFDGADSMVLDSQGDLILHTGGDDVRQHKPIIYQLINDERKEIAGGYTITSDRQVTFQLGEYDVSRPLVIDPVLSYSTFLGGNGATETSSNIAVDAAGQVYLVGTTGAADFPSSNPAQGSLRGQVDAFVTKLNAAGNGMVYSTFLGGNTGTQSGEIGFGIAVDGAGNAYVTGTTLSTNFPTLNAYQSTLSGALDAFVTKLSPSGVIVYSTYLGGNGAEFGFGIAVDTLGAPYIVGTTTSTDLLTGTRRLADPGDSGSVEIDQLANPEQAGLRGPSDAFVIKLAPVGDARVYGRYIGGGGPELGLAMTVDGSGSAYINGMTGSTDFPTLNPIQANSGGGQTDGFVVKVAVNGGSLVYSTYLGGSGNENYTFLLQIPFQGAGIAVDNEGNAYVAGTTDSTNFPTRNPLQPLFGGVADAYVTKINAAGNDFVYSTYVGGDNEDLGFNIDLDGAGNAYLTGTTISTNFPLSNPLQTSLKGTTDGFVSKLNSSGSAFVYSTFLGGGGDEIASGIAADAAGNAFIFGLTTSTDYPMAQPLQSSLKGGGDTFITKLSDSNSPPGNAVASVSAASYLGQELAIDSITAAFGTGLATRVEIANTLPLPTQLAGTTLRIRDSAGFEQAVPLFFVAPGQINYHIPFGFSLGNARTTVTSGDGSVATGTILITRVAPGLFSADTLGKGLAAAVVLRVRGDGSAVYEPVAQFDSSQSRFVPVPIDIGSLTDQVFLILYGTGMKFGTFGTLRATIGGADGDLFYNGPSGLVGLDQCNVRLPRILAGRGEVDVIFTADGKTSNPVKVVIR